MSLNRLKNSEITKEAFSKSFNEDGYVIVENVLSQEYIDSVIPELETAIDFEMKNYHSIDHKDYGMLLACPVYGGKLIKLVENKDYIRPFNWILDDTCIVWVYTSSSMPPNKTNHSARVHVDRPQFQPNFTEAMGSLVLLNDFTEENGATFFLPKSHLSSREPNEEEFYKNAVRLIAPKGSVFYFHLRMWHAGGVNHTSDWRHSLGIGMIRPYIKQRIDLPRALENTDTSKLSIEAKQKLGFLAQPPTSIAEYYENGRKKRLQRSEWEKENK